MTQFEFSKEEENLLKKIEIAKESLKECDEFMQKRKALLITLGIDLVSLEINLFLKKLFLCQECKADEHYEWIATQLTKRLITIHTLIEEKFYLHHNKIAAEN